jgi:hypothetical protein
MLETFGYVLGGFSLRKGVRWQRVMAGQLILVGHSLGVLVLKQVLRTAAAWAADRAEAVSFIERIHKVVFFATPQVSKAASGWGDWLLGSIRYLAAARPFLRNDAYLRDLERRTLS